MAIQEVIKYEGDNETLIYKYPEEDFNTLSQLIVHESQEAVFFSDGQALDSFKAGRYTLETKNIPLISKLRNLVTGGESPFHCEVYFINLAMMMNIVWGTPSKVTVKDPVYGYSYSAGASGSFGIRITDGRKLLIELNGTESSMDVTHIQKYFKDLIVTRVKNYIAVEMGRHSYNTLNEHLNDISSGIESQIQKDIDSFGIRIFQFYVSSVMIDENDLQELKNLDNKMAQKRYEAAGSRDAQIIEAEGKARAREIQGYTWAQEQQFEVGKTFAQNEGFAANPANMMAQIPVAITMGEMIKDSVNKNAGAVQSAAAPVTPQSQPLPQAESGQITCAKCGKTLPVTAKFCFNCGEKVSKEVHCLNCGRLMDEKEKFCMECGTARPEENA